MPMNRPKVDLRIADHDVLLLHSQNSTNRLHAPMQRRDRSGHIPRSSTDQVRQPPSPRCLGFPASSKHGKGVTHTLRQGGHTHFFYHARTCKRVLGQIPPVSQKNAFIRSSSPPCHHRRTTSRFNDGIDPIILLQLDVHLAIASTCSLNLSILILYAKDHLDGTIVSTAPSANLLQAPVALPHCSGVAEKRRSEEAHQHGDGDHDGCNGNSSVPKQKKADHLLPPVYIYIQEHATDALPLRTGKETLAAERYIIFYSQLEGAIRQMSHTSSLLPDQPRQRNVSRTTRRDASGSFLITSGTLNPSLPPRGQCPESVCWQTSAGQQSTCSSANPCPKPWLSPRHRFRHHLYSASQVYFFCTCQTPSAPSDAAPSSSTSWRTNLKCEDQY